MHATIGGIPYQDSHNHPQNRRVPLYPWVRLAIRAEGTCQSRPALRSCVSKAAIPSATCLSNRAGH